VTSKKDPLLKIIAKELSISATLFVNGVILSGTVFQGDGTEIFTTIPGHGDAFRDAFQNALEELRKDKKSEPDIILDDEEKDYIYMRPSRIILPNKIIELDQPGPVRIKLSSVDAFFIGELNW